MTKRSDAGDLFGAVIFLFLFLAVAGGAIMLLTAPTGGQAAPAVDPIAAYCRGASEGQAAVASISRAEAGIENPTIAQVDVDSMEAQCVEVLTTVGYNMPWHGPLMGEEEEGP